jgi:hypothetical protein
MVSECAPAHSLYVPRRMRTISRFTIISLSLALAGFAEDSPLGNQQKSTTHYDLVLSLARCFGQSAADAQTIANHSQATDSGRFNGIVVGFTNRFGPNAGWFHAPQLVPNALPELARWSDPSKRGTRYIPAGIPRQAPEMAALAGTLGAFGIYLHALGDSYSHKACTDHQYIPHCGEAGTPAARVFHTCATADETRYCEAPDAHTNEYGADPVLTANTKAGIRAIYAAMAQRFKKNPAIPANVGAILDSFATEMDPTKRVTLAASIPVNACAVAP